MPWNYQKKCINCGKTWEDPFYYEEKIQQDPCPFCGRTPDKSCVNSDSEILEDAIRTRK